MRALIAGSTGVLGRRLVQAFQARGYETLGTVRHADGADLLRRHGAVPVTADVFDSEALARATDHVDVVVHALTAIPNKTRTRPSDWAMNDRLRREGTRALTRYASMVGATQYVQQSVVWVARPVGGDRFDEETEPVPLPLLQSAFEGEQIAQEAGAAHAFRTSVLRFGSFYSADSAHTRAIAQGLRARRMPIIGSGMALLSNIHVDDAATAVVTAAESSLSATWHVVDDEPVPAATMLSDFARMLGAPTPWHIPVWLARLLAGQFSVDLLAVSTYTSNERFKAATGWAPVHPRVQAGLKQVVDSWVKDGWLSSGKPSGSAA